MRNARQVDRRSNSAMKIARYATLEDPQRGEQITFKLDVARYERARQAEFTRREEQTAKCDGGPDQHDAWTVARSESAAVKELEA
jgi:hypothetical protein